MLKNLLDGKTSSVEAIPIIDRYAKNIFGNTTQSGFISMGDKTIAITKITQQDGSLAYLYKINSDDFKITNNIKSIIGEKEIRWRN